MYGDQPPSADDAEQAATNAGMWDHVLGGQAHAAYGASLVALLGAGLLLGYFGGHLVILGIVLLVVGVGLFVDMWSHGFDH